MESIERAATILLFNSEDVKAQDVFSDYVTEYFNTQGIYGFDINTDVKVNGNEVIFELECDDLDNADWDDEEEDYYYDNFPSMVVGFVFRPGQEGADVNVVSH